MTNPAGRDRVPADLEIAAEREERSQREPDDPKRDRTYRNVRIVWKLRARIAAARTRH